MLATVAKKPTTTGGRDDGKRKPGRPSTGVPTTSLCCRAPETLADAFEKLANITGSLQKGTEMLKAAEDHLIRMYRLVRANPGALMLRDITGHAVDGFLKAAEAYLRESKRWPLPAAAD